MTMDTLRVAAERGVPAPEFLEALELQTRSALGEVRSISRQIRPEALDEQGLAQALRSEAGRVTAAGLPTVCDVELGEHPLSRPVETAVYRIVQEALANAVKHAAARTASVSVFVEAGEVRVVDYKTGSAPRAVHEAVALFQMKFYALALLHLRGVVPRQLRLLYLADGQSLTYSPDEAELRRFERVLDAIWAAIRAAGVTGDFRPNPGRACEWCSHRARCPAWGGEPPPYPGWPTDGATVEEPPGPLAAVLEHAD